MDFAEIKTIAVVGLSPEPDRNSHKVASYLKEKGFRIIPINPSVSEVLGERSYPDLARVPSEIDIDLVDIFRRSEHVGPIVTQALARGVKCIWMQEGVVNEEAARVCAKTGVEVTMDRCLMKEHRRHSSSHQG